MKNDNAKLKKQLKIVTGKDNQILRSKAKKIEKVSPGIKKLAAKMLKTMRIADGIGLAAPQVGKSIQLFLLDKLAFDKKLSKWEFKKISPPDVSQGFAFLNPSIATYPKGSEDMKEGCLSLPGWEGMVSRSKRITLKAQTVEGETFKLRAKGLLAKALQHEYDHLQGVLICDKWKNARRVEGKGFRVKGVVFFGDSPYSKIVLDKLKETPYEPEIVFSKTKPYTLTPKPYALGIVAAYGAIIPQKVIERFRYGIFNIHPSLLPKYRGPSPVQETILKGDKVAGVSIIALSERVDAGDVLMQQEFAVGKKYTTPELHQILFTMGAKLLLDVLPQWIAGTIIPKKQNENEATFTKLLRKEDGLINWKESPSLIERKIRAYQPWPTAYTFFEHRGKRLRVQLLEAQVATGTLPQTVYGNIGEKDRQLLVHCAGGNLIIKKLRPEGKRAMTGAEFLRGYHPPTFTL